MKHGQKILVTVLWGTLVLAMVGVVVGQLFHRERPAELPKYFPVPAFQLTDQLNQPVSNQTLAGHPYVAAFFFASCQSLCPALSGHMSRLQSELPTSVKLVSFSVDPDHDTPTVLEAYGKKYHADDSRWYFLTGPSQEIYDTEVGVKLTAPGNGLTALNHSDRLLLIDGAGEVRGVYESTDPDALTKLVTDAARLAGD